MKKFFVVIMIVIMTTVIGGCANTKFEKYMFFDRYRTMRAEENISKLTDQETTVEMYGTVLPLFEEDSHVSELFDEAKADIRAFYGGVDYFNWERFENSKLKQMKENAFTIEGFEGGANAAYLPNDNIVIVYSVIRSYPDRLAKETMAHELIHALTENENTTTTNPAIYEGLTEILSAELYRAEIQGYAISCNFVSMYMRVAGAEEAVKNILNGEVIEDVNSKTKPGAMEDVSKSILALDMGYGKEEDYLLYVDLIANYAINVGIIDEIADAIKEIRWSDPQAKEYFAWLVQQ